MQKMQPSNHSHYCPKCKGHKYCPQITHCQKPDESICMDCTPSLIKERAEETYYETGKWPGEKQ